jgi:uncharacterized protein
MERKVYQSLLQWKQAADRKPLLLWGARQVGKTWLLKEFGRKEFAHLHYVNFDIEPSLATIFERSLDPENILKELQFHLNTPINIETDLLIFDEVQRIPKALLSLKYFYENRPEIAICAAGSLLGIALSNEGFPVGKVQIQYIYPLDFEEFLMATEQELLLQLLAQQSWLEPLPHSAHEKLWEFWKYYLIIGGLPEPVKRFIALKENIYLAVNEAVELQRQLMDSYGADIAKHSGKLNAMHIERVWQNIPAQLAKNLDGSARKYVFKDAIPGYKSYDRLSGPIDWLEKANLLIKTNIIETPQLPLNAQIQENRFKLYLFDIGLLNAMTGLSAREIMAYDFGTYKGYLAENFVAQELTAMGSRSLFAWEGRQSEIEFVISNHGKIIALEVKSGWISKSKSIFVFMEKYEPEMALIFSANNVEIRDKRHFLPIYALQWALRALFKEPAPS